MLFRPSQHSYGAPSGVLPYYVKVGDNLYYISPGNEKIILKIQNGKPAHSEFLYTKALADIYKKDGEVVSTAVAKLLIRAVGPTTSAGGGALTGVYKDPDGYIYDISSSAITIYKKSGAKWKTVQSSDSGWAALNANLLQDKAKLTKATIPTETKSASASSSYRPVSEVMAEVSAARAKATDEAVEKKSILSHPATPYVLIGTAVVAAGGLAWYFLRSDAAEYAQPAEA